MHNAMLRNHLSWPETDSPANAIQRTHNNCNNKHGVDTAIILFAQYPRYRIDGFSLITKGCWKWCR